MKFLQIKHKPKTLNHKFFRQWVAYLVFFRNLLIVKLIKMKLLFSSFAVAAIALSACQPVGTRNDGVHGGNLRINISDIPHRVFPGYAEKRSEQIIVNQVYTGLVKYNQHTLQIVPSIAREHKLSPDELTYTFLLDTRARFQNDRCFENGEGRQIVASDVKYSIERICRNKLIEGIGLSRQVLNIAGADEFLPEAKDNDSVHISGIVAENDSVLIINLKEPDKLFLHYLAGTNALVFAPEAFNAYGINGTVGSGAFRFKYPKSVGNPYILTYNPNYWATTADGRLPYIDSLTITFITSTQKELYMFGAGMVDIIFDLPTKYLPDFLESNIDGFQSDPPRFIMTNTTKPNNEKRFNLYSARVKELYFNSLTYFDFSTVRLGGDN